MDNDQQLINSQPQSKKTSALNFQYFIGLVLIILTPLSMITNLIALFMLNHSYNYAIEKQVQYNQIVSLPVWIRYYWIPWLVFLLAYGSFIFIGIFLMKNPNWYRKKLVLLIIILAIYFIVLPYAYQYWIVSTWRYLINIVQAF